MQERFFGFGQSLRRLIGIRTDEEIRVARNAANDELCNIIADQLSHCITPEEASKRFDKYLKNPDAGLDTLRAAHKRFNH